MLTPNHGAPHLPWARAQGGFTLVEVTIALVILAVSVLGMTASAGVLGRYSTEVEVRALAVQALEDRIATIRAEGRYVDLEGSFAGSEHDLPGLAGFTRTTTVTRVREPVRGGGTLDYTIVTVLVEGDRLPRPLSRRLTFGAP